MGDQKIRNLDLLWGLGLSSDHAEHEGSAQQFFVGLRSEQIKKRRVAEHELLANKRAHCWKKRAKSLGSAAMRTGNVVALP